MNIRDSRVTFRANHWISSEHNSCLLILNLQRVSWDGGGVCNGNKLIIASICTSSIHPGTIQQSQNCCWKLQFKLLFVKLPILHSNCTLPAARCSQHPTSLLKLSWWFCSSFHTDSFGSSVEKIVIVVLLMISITWTCVFITARTRTAITNGVPKWGTKWTDWTNV